MAYTLPVERIIVGDRHRKDMGDIEGLARSINELGLLHPIVVRPDGTLIAGERRLRAVQMLGWQDVPVTMVDLEDVVRGEFAENTIRKDFTITEALAIAEALEPMERAAAKERQEAQDFGRGVTPVKFTGVSADNNRALDHVATAVGMSRPTLLKAREVQAAALSDPDKFGDLPEKMDKKSVDSAFREYRRRQAKETPPLPSDKYRVIYADPPWYYAQSVDGYGPADRHYPTMETEAICALPVADLAEDNAVLFLWATSPKLIDALGVAEAWGFRYSGAMFVWDKVDHNYGHYNSVRHELLLICTRGSCTPDERTLFDSVQSIKRTKHSEKPEEFRQMIDKLYTHGRRIELFARGQHDGWDVWGQDAERDSS